MRESVVNYPQPELQGPKDAVLKLTKGPQSGTAFKKGETVLSFSASDKTGQKADCQFKVIVADEEAPVVKCPSAITAKTEPGVKSKKIQYTAATAIDNCNQVNPTLSAGPNSGSDFPVGQTTVTFSASDEAGNKGECSFTVTVEGVAKPLTLKCPDNIQVATETGSCEKAVKYPRPEMSGPEDAVLSLASGLKSGAAFPKGISTQQFEATDNSGQKAQCQFTVTVKDEEAPKLVCPSDMKTKAAPEAETKTVTFDPPQVNDNCSAVEANRVAGFPSGDPFPLGETKISYQAKDEAGNESKCSFIIEVEPTVKPLKLKCPEDMVAVADPGECEKAVFYHAPEMSGPTGARMKRIAGLASGKPFPKGETKVSYGATEPNGQRKTCSFMVRVKDEEPPKLKCPRDTIVYPEPGDQRQPVSYPRVRATDNCDAVSPRLEAGLSSGSTFEAGKNVVVWSAEDESGNKANCRFTVTVEVRPEEIEGEKVVYDDDVIMVPSDQCYIYYYDDLENDGDIVSINVDGEWVVENERIRKKREDMTKTAHIKVNLDQEKLHFVIFRAIDEGKNPPCTLSLAIYNARNDFLQVRKIRFKIGESGGITLKRKK